MPNQQLIDFIKASQAIGQTDEQIKAVLRQNGWQDAAFAEAFTPPMPQMPQAPQLSVLQPQPNSPTMSVIATSVAPVISEQGSSSGKRIFFSIVVTVAALGIASGAVYAGYYYFVLNDTQPVMLPTLIATSTVEQQLPASTQSVVGTSAIEQNTATSSPIGAVSAETKQAVISGVDSERAILSSGNISQIRQLFQIVYKDLEPQLITASDSEILQRAATWTASIPTDIQLNSSAARWIQSAPNQVQVMMERESFVYMKINGQWY